MAEVPQDDILHLGDAPAGGSVAGKLVLVPGALAPILTLDLPRRLRGHAREQVALRQVRDRLGLTPEQVELHPLPGGAEGPDGWSRALLADRAQLAEWRQSAGTRSHALLPDYLALPTSPDLWVCRLNGAGMVQVRMGVRDGFSAAPAPARAMLARALDRGDRPRALLRLGEAVPEIEALAAENDFPVIDKPEAAAGLGLSAPKQLGHGELGWDLRRDPRAARMRLRRRVLPWRWPLLAGAVAAALWAAAQVIAIDRLQTQTRTALDEALTLARTHFVPDGPVLDIRSQVSRALRQRREMAGRVASDVSVLDLMAVVAPVLDAAGAAPKDLRYTPKEGLGLQVGMPDFAALDRLVAALGAEDGLDVTLQRSQVADEQAGVLGDILVTASAGEGPQ